VCILLSHEVLIGVQIPQVLDGSFSLLAPFFVSTLGPMVLDSFKICVMEGLVEGVGLTSIRKIFVQEASVG
jgi:hypothetical protein